MSKVGPVLEFEAEALTMGGPGHVEIAVMVQGGPIAILAGRAGRESVPVKARGSVLIMKAGKVRIRTKGHR